MTAFPFGEPTLQQFIKKAKEHGAELRVTPTFEGPRGPVRLRYLWIDEKRFVELPEISSDDFLMPDMVDQMARRLGIPPEEFWPGQISN